MRLVPVLTAIMVTAFLFFLVVQREDLLAFASASAGQSESAVAGTVPAPDTPPTETGKDRAAKVRVVAIHSRATTIDSAVVLRGQTEADRQVQVRAETSARVISEPLRRGTRVQKGDLLCELDPGTREASQSEALARLAEAEARVPETRARLEEAEARLQEARINNNAAQKLMQGGYASETRVASAEAAVRAAEAGVQSALSGQQSTEAGIQAAQAAVAAAAREIARLSITAPFAGLLESDTAELGSLLQPGALCATVIQLDPIRVVGFVPETEIAKIAPGALAGARLTTGQQVTGTVSFLSRSADETTRTFRVEVAVPNPDLTIRGGQTAEIAIAAPGADAHLIPQSALTLNDHGILGVRLVVDAGRVEFAPIRILRDSVNGVWVTGLAPEANVIIIGQEFVIAGVPVEAVYQEPQQ